jgi:hypothetical protein
MSLQLYDSFNARNYTPAQVAQTFISSEDYEDLWRNEHTVVLGPRGSGKTTLFKMLTIQALYSWSNVMAEKLKKDRPFTAIFVPTDMHWHHQLMHAEKYLQAAPRFSLAASRAAVTTSVLLAVTRTLQDRITFELTSHVHQEAELCNILIKEWMLPKLIPCLDMVALALKSRIGEIRRVVNHVIDRGVTDENIPTVPEYFHLDYFSQLDIACSAFDAIYKQPRSAKWAICLDELELAPEWLQDQAFSEQRSSEEKYLIKLSTSPIPKTLGKTESRPKQDVRLICLWNHVNRRGDGFDEELAKCFLGRKLGSNITPEMLLGKSDLVLQPEEHTTKYARGSAEWQLFKTIATWDNSFRALLESAGVNPDDPVTENISVRDSLLRKAKPVAMLRNAFLKPSIHGRVSLRSRKLGTIYHGREAVYQIADGNPRRLIGILGDLCSKRLSSTDASPQRLSNNEQAEILTRASLHFAGYVHALPGGNTLLGGNNIDLSTLLRTIGDYFRGRLLGPDFPLDPVGSFQVDSHINDKVVELLRLGVYHGALVYVDPVPDTIETSLRGKRFRLSYMLAPLNKLPLTLYDPISLSSILRSSFRLRVKRVLPEMIQQREFGLKIESEHETS